MKKMLTILLSLFMMLTVSITGVFAEETSGWKNDSTDEALSGNGGSYVIVPGGANGGAYNKDHVYDLLEDGIEEDLNVLVDVDGMGQSDYYEMSVSVKTAGNVYKTEQVIMVQKDGDKVNVTANDIDGVIPLEETDIYNFKWNFFKDDSGYIYATVTVTDSDGYVKGVFESDKLINIDSRGLIVHFDSGDHLGYLWVFHVNTANGVHVYENVVCTENYKKDDWKYVGTSADGSDDVYTVGECGPCDTDEGAISYKNVSKQLFDGITEKLNFYLDLDEMDSGELFETSVGIKDIKDVYKTEQPVSFQKTGDNQVTIRANGATNNIVETGSRFYTLEWNFSVDTTNKIVCVVNVYKDGTSVGSFETELEDAVSGDHLGYVWICNIQAQHGAHVYSTVPDKPEVNFVNLGDSYYVGDVEEFEISTNTHNRPIIMVKGEGELTGDDCVKLQYKEDDEWIDFPSGESSFGPAAGFPFVTTSSEFRAEFTRTGQSNYVIKIVDAKNGEILCQTEKTIEVTNRPAPSPKPKSKTKFVTPKTGIE